MLNHMLPRAALAAVIACLAAVVPASAATFTFGSDLTASANTTDSNPSDWSAWPVSPAGSAYVVPKQGEVTRVDVKGAVLRPSPDTGNYDPLFGFRVVVWRPQADGTLEAVQSSDALPFPFGGDAQRVTSFNLQGYPANKVCARPGDFVGITANGGYQPAEYPQGRPLQMFHRGTAGSSYVYSKGPFLLDGKSSSLYLGTTTAPKTRQGIELLMRTTIGTGADARWFCRTDAEKSANLDAPEPPASSTTPVSAGGVPSAKPAAGSGRARISVPGRAVILNKVVRFRIACATTASCAGTIKLRGPITVTKAFTMRRGKTKTIAVALSRKAATKLKRRRKLAVRVTLLRADGSRQRFSVRLRKA